MDVSENMTCTPGDLRLPINTFRDRLQYEAGAAESHWLDLLESRMKGRATEGRHRESRAEQQNRELEVARTMASLPRKERLVEWKRQTGKSEPAMYRALAKVD